MFDSTIIFLVLLELNVVNLTQLPLPMSLFVFGFLSWIANQVFSADSESDFKTTFVVYGTEWQNKEVFTDAKQICEDKNGKLAIINSEKLVQKAEKDLLAQISCKQKL